MKKRIFLLFALLLLVAAFTLSSCNYLFEVDKPDNGSSDGQGDNSGSDNNADSGSTGEENGDSGSSGEDSGSSDNTEGGGDNSGNAGGNTTLTKVNVDFIFDPLGIGDYQRALRLKVIPGETLSEEQLAEKDNLIYTGYGFCGYYSDKNLMWEFDFTKPISENTKIYCKRDMKEAGRNVTWRISGTTLYFEGSGDMYDFFNYEDVPWRDSARLTVRNVVIEDGITSVAARAFHSFKSIETVVLPASITRIGDNAFYYSSITHINFPEALHTIGNDVFNGCSSIKELIFNKGLQNIGRSAFFDCTSLTTVTFTDTIIRVGGGAFNGCINMDTVFYHGTEEQYNQITFNLDNFWVNQLSFRYFYSEEEPAQPGPFWKYGANGGIFKWYNTIWYIDGSINKVPFTMDFVDPFEGITNENVNFMNSIVNPGGYKYASWRTYDDYRKIYTMNVGTVLNDDIKLRGDRGNLCGDNLQWTINGTRLTISKINSKSADGKMWDFTGVTNSPWYGRTIGKIVISSGVTYIGSYAFSDIRSTHKQYGGLSYIDIPMSITEMHPNSIFGCNGLIYVYYSGADMSAVKGLDSLKNSPEMVVYLNYKAFDNPPVEGSFYDTVDVGNGDTARIAWTYKDGVLSVGAAGDEDHIIPDFLEPIFVPWNNYRNDVTEIVIRENVEKIGKYTFTYMSGVTKITVPEATERIDDTAFYETGYYNDQLQKNGCVFIYTKVHDNGQQYGHLIKVANPATPNSVFIIPEKTLTVSGGAFAGCSNISILVMGKDIKAQGITASTFANLASLNAICFTASSSEWGKYKDVDFLNDIASAGKLYFYSGNAGVTTPGKYWRWESSLPYLWEVTES